MLISCILFVFAIYDIVTERHVCAGDRDVSVNPCLQYIPVVTFESLLFACNDGILVSLLDSMRVIQCTVFNFDIAFVQCLDSLEI